MQHRPFIFLRSHPLLTLLSLLLLSVTLLPAPLSDLHWHGLRSVFVELGAAACLAFLIGQAGTPQGRNCWADALRAAPVRFLIAFFLWGGVTAAFTGAKIFAAQGLLLLGAGLVVTLTVCTQARTRPQYQLLLDALTAATLLLSLSGFTLYGYGKSQLLVGFYYDHQLYGAVFTVLLPLMLSLIFSPVTQSRRALAQAALLCGTLALVLSETRSAWLGISAAALAFALLVWRGNGMKHKRGTALPALLVAVVIAVFLTTTPQARSVRHRLDSFRLLSGTRVSGASAHPLSQSRATESVAWRLNVWHDARRMVFERPLRGWGIGTYPRYHSAFSRQGQPLDQVLRLGSTLPDEAHNSYLQIAVETGMVGLTLWLGVLVSTLWLGLSALRRMTPGGVRQWSLIGSLSALTGQSVDAIANPGWQFGEVSLFLWITLGLVVALALGIPQKIAEDETQRPEAPGKRVGQIMLASLIFVSLLWAIFQTAQALPTPTL